MVNLSGENKPIQLGPMPDDNGFFGEYGGSFVPPHLEAILKDITEAYNKMKVDPEFQREYRELLKQFVGRPSPIFHCKRLSEKIGGAQIYLKREDLNHTGAHKINHCIGEALLAKKMGKKKIMAETGAGQHGVALATAAAFLGLECDIYMGETDIAKQKPNVVRMRILGANIVAASHGRAGLKEAVDIAFKAYAENPADQFFAIGSVVGPHPYPMMVRDFQSIVGEEAKVQFDEMLGKAPDNLVACVGGGCNAIGLFSPFLDNSEVNCYGIEPAGRTLEKDGEHAATLTLGKPGIIHGFKCHVLQDDQGEPLLAYSVASGLGYPGIGPQHSYLKDIGRANYEAVSDDDAIDAFFELSRIEGIIPALESSHAVAYAMKLAKTLPPTKTILVNLSGRGDKDIDYVTEKYGAKYGIVEH